MTAPRLRREHIVATDGTQAGVPAGFLCLRCRTHAAVPLPVPVSLYVRLAAEFSSQHAACRPPASAPEPTP